MTCRVERTLQKFSFWIIGVQKWRPKEIMFCFRSSPAPSQCQSWLSQLWRDTVIDLLLSLKTGAKKTSENAEWVMLRARHNEMKLRLQSGSLSQSHNVFSLWPVTLTKRPFSKAFSHNGEISLFPGNDWGGWQKTNNGRTVCVRWD